MAIKYEERNLSAEFEHIYLIPISDCHVGDPHFNEPKLRGYLDWILERPNAYTILNGDLIDAAIADSVGDTYDAKMNTDQALEYVQRLFMPLAKAGRILGITDGNHEARVRRKTGVDISRILASTLFGIDDYGPYYGREGLLLKLRFGQRATNGKPQVYTVYITHGTGGGRTIGGKMNKLDWMSNIVMADIYLVGHIHFMTTFQDVYFVPDLRNGKLDEVKRTYASSGAYLDYGGYGQSHLYSPVKLGSPRLRLDGAKKDVHVSI